MSIDVKHPRRMLARVLSVNQDFVDGPFGQRRGIVHISPLKFMS